MKTQAQYFYKSRNRPSKNLQNAFLGGGITWSEKNQKFLYHTAQILTKVGDGYFKLSNLV